jgi:uncharacterized protein YjbJ (UPF0337 family)
MISKKTSKTNDAVLCSQDQIGKLTGLLHGGSRILINTFLQEINMKLTNMKLTGLGAVMVLTFCSVGAYATESQETAPINKDQVEGRVDEAQGKVKEATGVIMDDKKMQLEGNVQKNVGKAQKGYGDIKQELQSDK